MIFMESVSVALYQITSSLLKYQLILAGLLFGGILLYLLVQKLKFDNSMYHKETGYTFRHVFFEKGFRGEYETWRNLSGYASSGARFLFNCYIPKKNGETTEIDMIMIHRTGIYVIESKNYSGWIFGNESDQMWTQSLAEGEKSRKERFYNPVRQNASHIRYLSELLKVEGSVFYSLIVFSKRCELKSVTTEVSRISVVKRNNLKSTLSNIVKNRSVLLSDEETDRIYHVLINYCNVSNQEKKDHIDRLSKMKETQSQDHVMRCPRCGGFLVLRTVKRGAEAGKQFYGCSNYPKCRYTKNISEDKETL